MSPEEKTRSPEACLPDTPLGQPSEPVRCTGPRGLLRNLRAGLRGALFRRIAADALCATPGQLIVLVLASVALQLGVAILAAAGEGQLNPAALPRALVYVPLLLFAAWLAGLGARSRNVLVELAVLFCSISLPLDVAFEALGGLDRAGWPFLPDSVDADAWSARLWDLIYVWWLCAIVVAVARRVDGGRVRRGLSGIALVAIVAAPSWYMPNLNLWETPEDLAADGEQSSVSQEEVLYTQPALLDDALDRLEPERPGVADLYFVGVAGYAAEDVFMKELDVVGALFRERFDTTGRMIALVNNPKTVSAVPVATSTGLSRVLGELGEVMDTDEDVLFLYLTSHGSEDHRFAMQFSPLQLHDLEPKMLRAMLDESRIRWRVIVISACYSGGFIEALKDEHTLIITASDAEHQSFGCGAGSDFTWFGRAYFDQALRETTSFTDGFTRAKAAIEALEKAQSLPPSNPQMSVGAAMPAKLRELSERLSKQPKDLPLHAPGRLVRLDMRSASQGR